MEYKITKDNLNITMILDNTSNVLSLIILDTELCEEYNSNICDAQIACNKVMDSTKKLFDMIKCGFENTTNTVKLYYQKNTKINNEIEYQFSVYFDCEFIKDKMDIVLTKNDKHVSPKQICDCIDGKFKKISDLLENKYNMNVNLIDNVMSKNNVNEKDISDLRNNFNSMRVEMLAYVDDCTNLNKSTKLQCEEMNGKLIEKTNELNDYILCQPIYFTYNKDVNIYPKPTYITQINSKFGLRQTCGGTCVFGNKCRIINREHTTFDIKMMKYIIDKITGIEIDSYCWKDLEMFPANNSVTSIVLENMEELKSVKHLVTFTNLQTIDIIGKHDIKDLYTLINCKQLTQLTVPVGTNVQVFPNDAHFKIVVK